MKVKQEIIEICKNTNPSGISSKLKSNKNFKEEIDNYNINWDTSSFSEKVYLYINDLTPPHCECKNKTKFISLSKGYNKFCKSSCEFAKKQQVKKRLDTQIRNGGIGLANRKTKEKANNTLKEKYNIQNPGQIEDHKLKMKSNNPMQDKSTIENIRKNCIKNHNVDWHSKRVDVKNKTKKSIIEFYGIDNVSKINYSENTLNTLDNKEKLLELYNSKSINEISEYLNVSLTTIYNYLLKHDIREKSQVVAEQQIVNFLHSIGITNIQQRTRKIIKPYELDIFLPEYNIAIEHCGLYWHSHNNGFTRYYHYNKWKKCQEKNIFLITMFEDEWIKKRKICENRIIHALQKNKKEKGARNLTIKEIFEKDIVYNFLDNYHIQGRSKYSIALGAFDNNELVSLMTFSFPRKYMNQQYIELSRFVTNGKSYPGVGNKLFKHYIKKFNPDIIISMCDIRWGNGNFYKFLGMEFISHTSPNYWYFGDKSDKLRRWYRYYFNKKVLLNKYPCYKDKNYSEWDIMQDLGYNKIWDCGNFKFQWSKK